MLYVCLLSTIVESKQTHTIITISSQDEQLGSDVYLDGTVVDGFSALSETFPDVENIQIASSVFCHGVRSARGDFVFILGEDRRVKVGRVRCHVLAQPAPGFVVVYDNFRPATVYRANGSRRLHTYILEAGGQASMCEVSAVISSAIWSDTACLGYIVVLPSPSLNFGTSSNRFVME